MAHSSMFARVAEQITSNSKLDTPYIAPAGHNSPQIAGFGSWLDSLNDIATHGIGWTALANTSSKSIWNAADTPSPGCGRLSEFRTRATPVVHSHCELVHPRPTTFWVIAQENVSNMERQAAAMAKERQRELRAVGRGDDGDDDDVDEVRFERSDEDEIVHLPKRRRVVGYDWAAAIASLPKSSKAFNRSTPTGSV